MEGGMVGEAPLSRNTRNVTGDEANALSRVEAAVVDRLQAMRRPGESYSDVIPAPRRDRGRTTALAARRAHGRRKRLVRSGFGLDIFQASQPVCRLLAEPDRNLLGGDIFERLGQERVGANEDS
jgi:hypothetical protein